MFPVKMIISGKEVILNTSFIVLDNEEIKLESAVIPGSPASVLPFIILIKFLPGDETANSATLNWETNKERNELKLNFIGWKNTLGTSLTVPQKIGQIGGKD